MAPARIAVPGDVVGSAATQTAGAGTFARGGDIVSSLVGAVAVGGDGRVTVRGRAPRPRIGVGAVVVGRVARVGAAHVNLDLVAADGAVLDYPARAALRREDVRFRRRPSPEPRRTRAPFPPRQVVPAGQDPSALDLAATFRGADLVRAKVISADDRLRYAVAVNEPGLGRVVPAGTS